MTFLEKSGAGQMSPRRLAPSTSFEIFESRWCWREPWPATKARGLRELRRELRRSRYGDIKMFVFPDMIWIYKIIWFTPDYTVYPALPFS
jgi:hypothetical protein